MPTPTGTGFFISSDGWFVTAAHVITENGSPNGPVRNDFDKTWLMKERRIGVENSGAMCQSISFGHVLPDVDFALLKVDFDSNSNKAWLAGKDAFPHITVSRRILDEGEPVYAFGYPLSTASAQNMGNAVIGASSLSPRVTSAIISSSFEHSKMVMTERDPKVYVLDKALNYGNSGGPIVSSETGNVFALCSRFQPVAIQQPHIRMSDNAPMAIHIPSLYGIVASLADDAIVDLLKELNIPVVDV
tara:strand:- start:102 stop:836 length:735 start_codon:yes stop_codon:yes gene_type:complete